MSTTTQTLSVAQVQQAFDNSTFIAWLGMRVVSLDHDAQIIEVEIPFQASFERGKGTRQWHGGPLAAVIDTVGDFAVGMLVGRGLPTVNFRVDYLRPAIDTDLRAVARVRRLGKSIGVADVDLFNAQGALVAIGRASYATLPPA
ncbi:MULTISPECIES: PaaI family thioesterase [Pandoraea]|uniref:PaaI family thioesterase n=1 Tax=Pandoraea TaxID=93217 RepID=UPI0008463728|nr:MULTISPECIES: PaaI family thioesterase [Pandoraea]MCI3206194.1 PaaI family thioesterase [Pandoraea sp. LA3]MDN4584222.1 PaaI family thioesterase [Pandoraea capi]ODP35654.1 thioesterase [Pandoraea sp. ISTKB]